MNEEQAHLAWRPAQRHPDFENSRSRSFESSGKKDPAENFEIFLDDEEENTGNTKVLRSENLPEPILIA